MAQESDEKDAKRRTKVGDLPEAEKELTGEDLKKVKGGIGIATDSELKDTYKYSQTHKDPDA
jgi:hypothetical protein